MVTENGICSNGMTRKFAMNASQKLTGRVKCTMSIQITITAETAADTIQLVQDLAGALGSMDPADNPAKTEVSTIEEPKKETKKTAPKKEEPKKETKAPEPEPEREDVPSASDVRKKAQTVGKDPEKKPLIKELLKELGIPNVSSVPADRRAEFIQRLEEL